MGRPFSKPSLLELVHKFIYDTLPAEQYGCGCILISRFVEAVTGIPAKVVALRSHGRIIAHWVNVTEFGDVIDCKSRVFFQNIYEPLHSTWQGNHFMPEGRNVSEYNLKPTAKTFQNKKEVRHYLEHLRISMKPENFPEEWKKYAELLVNTW